MQQEKLVIPGEVLKAESIGPDKLGRELFSINARCPHCGNETHYGKISRHEFTNYSVQPGLHKLSCRSCYQRYDVSVVDSLNDSCFDR